MKNFRTTLNHTQEIFRRIIQCFYLSIFSTKEPHPFLLATLYGLEANFTAAREALEAINRKSPSKPQVLIRLIQVSEQMRDYAAAVGYLRHAMRIVKNSQELDFKRQRYQESGFL